jgi:hypothetical protein
MPPKHDSQSYARKISSRFLGWSFFVNSIMSRLNRLMPIFVAAIGIVAIVQLFVYLGQWLSKVPVAAWLAEYAQVIEWALASAAAISVSLVVLGWLRATARIPKFLTRWTWLMDVLDRLTNRRELEQRLQSKPEAVFIDAEALSQSRKSQVVGQNAICGDLAAQIRRRLALQQGGKPLGVSLFAGPPGAGKTYLGKVLAGALDRKLIHVDMTQYS